jgi:hypothetical protein
MRRAIWIGVAALAAVMAGAVALVLWTTLGNAPRPTPVLVPPPPPQRAMVFSNEGEAAAVTGAIERILPPGSVKTALITAGPARHVCVLTAGPARGATLDDGLSPEDYPWLAEGGFATPASDPGKSLSIIRSTVKSVIGYNAGKGDRIIVLTCPKEDWETLRLTWPAAKDTP